MELRAEKAQRRFLRQGSGTNMFTAVEETDLTLRGGELTVLTGRSGGGKTTLLNMLSGLLAPSSGRIVLDGTDIYSLTDKELSRLRNERFGVIPQGQTAIHSLTVLENVLLPMTLTGAAPDEALALSLMGRLGISDLRQAKPRELSGGELRRMAVARALIRQPGAIFADEPTGDLDDENTALVFGFLREAARNGAAVLVVTHEAGAEEYADRVCRMDGGRLSIVR